MSTKKLIAVFLCLACFAILAPAAKTDAFSFTDLQNKIESLRQQILQLFELFGQIKPAPETQMTCFDACKAKGYETGMCNTWSLGNPASTYCTDMGYTLETRIDANGGQTNICMFGDGKECDEWKFYRKECGTEYVKTDYVSSMGCSAGLFQIDKTSDCGAKTGVAGSGSACCCQKKQAVNVCPAPVLSGEACEQVVTYAKNPDTGECCEYGTPCAAPQGWKTFASANECKGNASKTCEQLCQAIGYAKSRCAAWGLGSGGRIIGTAGCNKNELTIGSSQASDCNSKEIVGGGRACCCMNLPSACAQAGQSCSLLKCAASDAAAKCPGGSDCCAGLTCQAGTDALNGTCAKKDGECAGAGDSIDTSGQKKCCAGLDSLVSLMDSDGNCIDENTVSADSWTCSDCGNKTCDAGENKCNCAQDCKTGISQYGCAKDSDCASDSGTCHQCFNSDWWAALDISQRKTYICDGIGDSLCKCGAGKCVIASVCGDGTCDAADGETKSNCQKDCDTAATCDRLCRNLNYASGYCGTYAISPDGFKNMCKSGEYKLSQSGSDCIVASNIVGVGKTCCCKEN